PFFFAPIFRVASNLDGPLARPRRGGAEGVKQLVQVLFEPPIRPEEVGIERQEEVSHVVGYLLRRAQGGEGGACEYGGEDLDHDGEAIALMAALFAFSPPGARALVRPGRARDRVPIRLP